MASKNNSTPKPGSLLVPLRFVLKGYHRALALVAAAALAGGLAEAVFLVTITRAALAITDGAERVGIVAGWFVSINQMLLLAVLLVVVRVALAGLSIWQTARVSTSVVARIRGRLSRAYLESSWEVQQNQQTGGLQQFVLGFSGKASGLMSGASGGLVALANLVAMLGLAIAIDPLGAVAMLVAVIVLAVVLRPIRSMVRVRARANNRASIQLATNVSETENMGKELHVFHVQGPARKRLEVGIAQLRRTQRSLSVVASSASTVYSGVAYFALIGALFAVTYSSAASLSSIGAALLVMLRSLSYGQALQGSYLAIITNAPGVEDLIEQVDLFESERRRDGGEPVGSVGSVDLDDVSFAYEPGQPVLRDVSFHLDSREVVGIVGPSGGGKSTLVELILGLRDPQEGSIRVDGRDIGQLDKTEWARKVTFVPQAAHLISGSIADNIRFMRDDVTDEQVERAARLAYLHDDIAQFTDGYDRSVGAKGDHLSGGQQQRLCIARALVEQPDVLILDEPTSALDVHSENLIRTTLLELKEHMTVIIIAHRLSTLDICDRIMVIQEGRIVGFDSPDRLEASNAFYREAVALSGLH